jgi:hypothetical protein
MNRGIQLGIDSQCLSYVIDAMAGISEPSDSLAVQKLALVRLFFHLPDTLWVTPTVTLECARIRNTDRAALHASFIRVLFGELQIKKQQSVNARAADLRRHHSGENDCTILAEAEDVGHNVLLTFDTNFVRHLASHAAGVELLQPAEYWEHLALPRGSTPDKVPHSMNPLSAESWWRW